MAWSQYCGAGKDT
uniref:Uncharacterized protein n=1 Tax=Arundo donax TaxID=35708 RepID=A0A0A8Y7N2_ARUDO